MPEPVQKFHKLLSSHVEPVIFRVRVSFESCRHRRTDKEEWQFSVEGGVGKLDGGIRKLIGVVGKVAEGFKFLPNLVPSLTGTFGEFPQFGIDFAVCVPSFGSRVGLLCKPSLFAIPCDTLS